MLSYPEPVVPFIEVVAALPIDNWSYYPATGPLNGMFATIFNVDPSNRSIACGMRYGYQLAPGGQSAGRSRA